MRSTEPSGVEAEGFALFAADERAQEPGRAALLTRPFGRIVSSISPVTLAVALTALLAVSLFLIYDLARALHEARAFSSAPETVAIDALLTGVLWRGGVALAVAGLLVTLTFRRRGTDGATVIDRRRADDVLTALPFGIACWTGDGRLVLHNSQYCLRLGLDSACVRPGASYKATVTRFIDGGSIKRVTVAL